MPTFDLTCHCDPASWGEDGPGAICEARVAGNEPEGWLCPACWHDARCHRPAESKIEKALNHIDDAQLKGFDWALQKIKGENSND